MFNFQKGRRNKALIIILLLFVFLSSQITNCFELHNLAARSSVRIKKLIEKKIDHESSETTEFGKIIK